MSIVIWLSSVWIHLCSWIILGKSVHAEYTWKGLPHCTDTWLSDLVAKLTIRQGTLDNQFYPSGLNIGTLKLMLEIKTLRPSPFNLIHSHLKEIFWHEHGRLQKFTDESEFEMTAECKATFERCTDFLLEVLCKCDVLFIFLWHIVSLNGKWQLAIWKWIFWAKVVASKIEDYTLFLKRNTTNFSESIFPGDPWSRSIS